MIGNLFQMIAVIIKELFSLYRTIIVCATVLVIFYIWLKSQEADAASQAAEEGVEADPAEEEEMQLKRLTVSDLISHLPGIGILLLFLFGGVVLEYRLFALFTGDNLFRSIVSLAILTFLAINVEKITKKTFDIVIKVKKWLENLCEE